MLITEVNYAISIYELTQNGRDLHMTKLLRHILNLISIFLKGYAAQHDAAAAAAAANKVNKVIIIMTESTKINVQIVHFLLANVEGLVRSCWRPSFRGFLWPRLWRFQRRTRQFLRWFRWGLRSWMPRLLNSEIIFIGCYYATLLFLFANVDRSTKLTYLIKFRFRTHINFLIISMYDASKRINYRPLQDIDELIQHLTNEAIN